MGSENVKCGKKFKFVAVVDVEFQRKAPSTQQGRHRTDEVKVFFNFLISF